MPEREDQDRQQETGGVNSQENRTETSTSVNSETPQSQQTAQSGGGLGGGVNANFGALTVQANAGMSQVSGSLNMLGGVTPLQPGQLQGQSTPEGYNIRYSGNLAIQNNVPGVSFKGLSLTNVVANQNGLQNLSIRAEGLRIGNKLVQLSGIQANMIGNAPQFSATVASGVAKLFGKEVVMPATTISIGSDGKLQQIASGNLQIGSDISAQQLLWDGTKLQLISTQMLTTPIFEQKLPVEFSNIAFNTDGSYTGNGSFNPSTGINFMHDSMKLSNMVGTVSYQNNKWNVDVNGDLSYMNLPNVTLGGKGRLVMNEGGRPVFSIVGGSMNADLGGVNLTAQGVEYDDSTHVLKFISGATAVIDDPKMTGGLSATIPQLTLDSRGFDFKDIPMPGDINMEALPGVNATIKEAVLHDRGTDQVVLTGAVEVLSQQDPHVQAEGSISYNLSAGRFNSEINTLHVFNEMFSFLAENGVRFDENGFTVSVAGEMFIAEDCDLEKLKTIAPSLAQMSQEQLTALRGKTVQISDFRYTKTEGLQLGQITAEGEETTEIPLSIPDLGINTNISVSKDSGEISVSKEFSLPDVDVSIDIPIVGPVVASASIGVDVSAELSGNIGWRKEDGNIVLSGGLGFSGFAGVFAEIGVGINAIIAKIRVGAGAKFGLNFEGAAGVEAAFAQNPEATRLTEKLTPVSPIKFGYFFDANLISSIYLFVEAEALFGLIQSRKEWDLKTWTLGSLLASGASEGRNAGEILKNLQNHLVFVSKKGKPHNIYGNPVTLPESIENKRNSDNAKRINEMKGIAAQEKEKESKE